jgi:translation initiation factor 2B subunit (eIF-2B alpha/beta/delta family)
MIETMDNEEKLVVLEKYPNAVDANIVKGALEASGIPAGVIVDSTANAIWMAPVRVVVFERDLELARKVISESDTLADDTTED